MQEEAVVAADVVAYLAGRLQERLRLDVADRAADLGDDDVHELAVLARLGHRRMRALISFGDVRDDLDGVAEVLAAALLGDDLGVDLAGGDVGAARQVDVEEPLVVADVEVGLGAVVGDEHLAVLERVHRARVDVEVGVELLHRHVQPARLQQRAETAGGQALAEGGGDSAGDEQMLGRASGRRQVAAPASRSDDLRDSTITVRRRTAGRRGGQSPQSCVPLLRSPPRTRWQNAR